MFCFFLGSHPNGTKKQKKKEKKEKEKKKDWPHFADEFDESGVVRVERLLFLVAGGAQLADEPAAPAAADAGVVGVGVGAQTSEVVVHLRQQLQDARPLVLDVEVVVVVDVVGQRTLPAADCFFLFVFRLKKEKKISISFFLALCEVFVVDI